MTVLDVAPEVRAKVSAAYERGHADPHVADPTDPWMCQGCGHFPATTLVTFADAAAFEVCGRCATLAAIDGTIFTAISDLELVSP